MYIPLEITPASVDAFHNRAYLRSNTINLSLWYWYLLPIEKILNCLKFELVKGIIAKQSSLQPNDQAG